jgi:hypothetical protein
MFRSRIFPFSLVSPVSPFSLMRHVALFPPVPPSLVA